MDPVGSTKGSIKYNRIEKKFIEHCQQQANTRRVDKQKSGNNSQGNEGTAGAIDADVERMLSENRAKAATGDLRVILRKKKKAGGGDYSHMKKSSYRGKIGSRPPKASGLVQSEIRSILAEDFRVLTAPPIKKSTQKQADSQHRYFDGFMQTVGLDNIPTPSKAILCLAHMARENYSIRYMKNFVSALKRHPRMQMNPDDFAADVNMRNALTNLSKQILEQEDSRVPMLIEMAREFCGILDRDFSIYTALSCKAAIWLSFTAMLRRSKGAISAAADDPALTPEQVTASKKSVKITFHGWKSCNSRRTIVFPYMKGTEKEAYAAISQYMKVRDGMLKEDTRALFLNDAGQVMLRPTFDEIWHHVVDHSSYVGLNVTLHSMRIGGATV